MKINLSKYFFCLYLCGCFVTAGFPQENEYHLNLYKDNISWIWQGALNWEKSTGQKSQFYFNNLFNSNLFRETRRGNKWKDENTLKTGWSYRVSSTLSLSSKIRSHVFSDENSFVKFSKHLLFQEVEFILRPRIRISPAIGLASEDVYSFRDQGWYTHMNVNVRKYDLWGYINHTDAISAVYFFPERKNQEHRYYISLNKQFSRLASDSIRVGYEFLDNSYHLSRADQMESVEVNSRFLYNLLNYRFTEHSFLNIETRLQNRDVSQMNPNLENRREEIELFNSVHLRYGGRRFQGGFSFLTSQVSNIATRKTPIGEGVRTDIEGVQAAFNLFMNWKMSPSDEMRTTFSYTKYEYSSPDTTQKIDEDDIRFIGNLIYRHRFSPYFQFILNGHLYLYHQIYIFASRSANNNWNRIYQLAPALRFTLPGVLEHTTRFKILANYTVYDFEEILPEIRSYIHRKFVYTDSLSLKLTGGLQLVSVYQLEKEDNGTFFKEIFAQQVSRELTSHFIDISLVFLRINGLKFITGVNWYLRKEWSFLPEKRLTRDYRSFSPRVKLIFSPGKRLLFHIVYAPRVYQDINQKKRYYGTGRINLKYLF